jgi:hypothetical protein
MNDRLNALKISFIISSVNIVVIGHAMQDVFDFRAHFIRRGIVQHAFQLHADHLLTKYGAFLLFFEFVADPAEVVDLFGLYLEILNLDCQLIVLLLHLIVVHKLSFI